MYKENLDTRICDINPEASNTETFREFIALTEDYFGINNQNLGIMTEEELITYLNFLGDL